MKQLKYQIDPADFQLLSAEMKKNICVYDIIDSGYDAVEKGDFETALARFSEGAAIDNQDTEILNGLGLTLCELGRLGEARGILHRAERIEPKDPITYANLAGVYWDLEEFDRAIFYYSEALKLNPSLEDIHFNLINLYMEIGYFYIAYTTALNFVDMFPANEEIKEVMEDIMINLALLHY